MQSKAATVAEYLLSLPPERRDAVLAVREVFAKHLDRDIEEGMTYGMIGYYVPHRVFAPGYHCDPKMPLPYAGLASQKNYLSLYLMGLYADGEDALSVWFRKAWAKTGKKLDMGKCCIRWKKVEDLALDVIAEALQRMPTQRYIEIYTEQLAKQGKGVDGKPLGKGTKAAAPARSKPAAAKSAKAAAKAPSKARKAAAKKPAKAKGRAR